ncbi:MAG: proline racemase family protein [Propionibacteriaceae bacterium]|jgi:proline racemase|nr:proline racemase family protein [Propionibacteriaceae bacterium]
MEIWTTEYHTAGEPFRIVAEPPVAIVGETVAAKRVFAMRDPEVDGLRQLLCFEPRGHADMYGCLVVPPNDAGADLGVLFWHKDGFSTACGHGTIAVGAWAVNSGRVAAPADGVVDVRIDVPSGRVTARVHTEGGKARAVDFINVPSYLIAQRVPVSTSLGELHVDVSFGGAIYAQLNVADVGLSVTPADLTQLIEIGREIKWALNDAPVAQHPTDERLSGIYGTIIYEELEPVAAQPGAAPSLTQRNVTIFADGEVDRSPCGSGTAARVATLYAQGQLAPGELLVHDSIIGSRFLATIIDTVSEVGQPAIIPMITGAAFQTGESHFTVDPADDLTPGFVLR